MTTIRFGWVPERRPKPEIGLVEEDERLFVVEQRDGSVRVVGVVAFVAADATMQRAIDRYIGNGSTSEPST